MAIEIFRRGRDSTPLISSLYPMARRFRKWDGGGVDRAGAPAVVPAGITARREPEARLAQIPALDGLRALAVLLVLFYHAELRWLPGGFLGVGVFFVISGYLITSLLLAEISASGRVDFKAFWLRRARRLLPALFLVLLGVAGFAIVFLPEEVASLRGDIFSAAAYFNNWYQIFDHKSYFETVGRPSLLRHMWSLAIEEQFYLAWPVVFSLLMWRRRRWLALGIVLAGVLFSAVGMAALFRPDLDPSRLYFGTDTRAGELLIGAALALLWPPGRAGGKSGELRAKLPERRSGWNPTLQESTAIARFGQWRAGFHAGRGGFARGSWGWMADAAGCGLLGLLIACAMLLSESQALLYRGGFALVGLTTAGLIAAAVNPHARLVARLLCWGPLRWIGLRSYGIYLWHYPVFMVTRPELDVPIGGARLLLLRFGLTLLLAELSYRFVETPIRKGVLGRSWRAWREAQGCRKCRLGWQWAAASVSVAAVVSFLGLLLLRAHPPPVPDYLAVAIAPRSLPPAAVAIPRVIESNAPPVGAAAAKPSPAAGSATNGATPVTAIGDSVMLGVSEELQTVLNGNVIVDADQGRLPWKMNKLLQNLALERKSNSTVIVHIGNNGIFTADMFAQMMGELKHARRVVVVNLKVPRTWEGANNAMLAEAVKRYTNAVLVDWHGASRNRPELFWKDGLHLRPNGAKVYAALLAQAVAATNAASTELRLAAAGR